MRAAGTGKRLAAILRNVPAPEPHPSDVSVEPADELVGPFARVPLLPRSSPSSLSLFALLSKVKTIDTTMSNHQ